MKHKLSREQILCLAAGVLLSVFGFISSSSDLLKFSEGGQVSISRPDYGEDAAKEEVIVKAGSDEYTAQVPLSARLYTEEEAIALFEEMMDAVMETLQAENASLQEVKTDLCFADSLAAYPGISLDWQSPDLNLITREGEVLNQALEEQKELTLQLTMKAGQYQQELNVPVMVIPNPDRVPVASWEERFETLLKETDLGTIHESEVALPSEFEGEKLSYSVERDYSFLIYLLLGVAGAVAIALKPSQDEKQKKKERETELLLDYSEIVSKLIVYIGAGLTVRNAWKQLAETARKEGNDRAVYREILRTNAELENGETEEAAYMHFARRCDLRCYIRMVSLLEQNRKTGDSALLSALELEMEEAFEQRKNIARRLGEEAGTRLLAPLMISLVTVMVIVIVPAISSMG